MPVRYDPLLTLALANAIERRWLGAGVTRIAMDPERNAATVSFSDGGALAALFDRRVGVVAALAEDPLDGKARVTRLGRLTLTGVDAPPDERTILLWLAEPNGSRSTAVVLELQTNRWNVFSLTPGRGEEASDWRVRYALWTRDVAGRRIGPGEPYAAPRSERRAVDAAPSPAEWDAWLAEAASSDGTIERTAALETWGWTSALNFDRVFSDLAASYDRYSELHEARRRLLDGDLHLFVGERRWGLQPYPLDVAAPGRRHEDPLDGLDEALEAAGGVPAALGGDERTVPGDDAEILRRRLQKRADGEAKRVAALERQLASAGRPDGPRELGQILLARKDRVPRGARSVVLQAFDGSVREIALDPKLDVIGNAERFFEEARRRERALEKLPGEIASARTRMRGFRDALERLEREGPGDDLWRLVGRRPPRSRRAASSGSERLPYVRLVSSSGLEIRVGRGARDNDDLTFRHSAPDDIWLHASQASGAHVILRWGRREENPPKRDLIEAATAAAVNSQARHSGAVAVVWTRRKYVRKPRRSPPGTVVPTRAETLMVEPNEELVRELRPGD